MEKSNLNTFSHIYLEKQARSRPETADILRRFPHAELVEIDSYKDVFCRRKQDFALQKQRQNLIIALKQPPYLYPGSDNCQNFGNSCFTYASCVMNCIYQCEYCYLSGMYASGNLVVFVNMEETFRAVDELLARQSVYLCVSYDTDLLALENLFGFVRRWLDFAATRQNLTLEIRTKSDNFRAVADIPPTKNVIFAWTLAPDAVCTEYERKASALPARINAIKAAAERGWHVRLCFDPVLCEPRFEGHYAHLPQQIFSVLDPNSVCDVGLGAFRVSREYLKNMRRHYPHSALLNYPFPCAGGSYSYPADAQKRTLSVLTDALCQFVPEEKLFTWSNTEKENE